MYHVCIWKTSVFDSFCVENHSNLFQTMIDKWNAVNIDIYILYMNIV